MVSSTALFSTATTFQGLRPFNKPTDRVSLSLLPPQATRISTKRAKRVGTAPIRAELNPSLVISLSTGLSLFLGRFVFFNFQRENVAKQGLPEQNGMTHFEAGDTRAKEAFFKGIEGEFRQTSMSCPRIPYSNIKYSGKTW
ncbi:hypothetical protein Ancab_024847 [Ancistrocladus abbreviatus]